jgi:GTPase SAR1 family protein
MGGKGSKNKPVKKPETPPTSGGQGNPTSNQATSDKEDRVDHILKICIIGDANVGKTSILLRFVEDTFVENVKVKTNEEFLTKVIEHKGDKIKLIMVSYSDWLW